MRGGFYICSYKCVFILSRGRNRSCPRKLNINVNVKILHFLSLDFIVNVLIVSVGSQKKYNKINKICYVLGERR